MGSQGPGMRGSAVCIEVTLKAQVLPSWVCGMANVKAQLKGMCDREGPTASLSLE